jgi:hypothetical protein
MKRSVQRHREDDCLSLLQWVSKHRDTKQTYESLSEATGVPTTLIFRLITEAEQDPYGSALTRAAYRFRFEWEIKTPDGKILDAEYRGYQNG